MLNADDIDDGTGTYHADCESCHLGCAPALPAPGLGVVESPPEEVHGGHGALYRSHIPSGLERPDRNELAAAARFGGVVAFGPILA